MELSGGIAKIAAFGFDNNRCLRWWSLSRNDRSDLPTDHLARLNCHLVQKASATT